MGGHGVGEEVSPDGELSKIDDFILPAFPVISSVFSSCCLRYLSRWCFGGSLLVRRLTGDHLWNRAGLVSDNYLLESPRRKAEKAKNRGTIHFKRSRKASDNTRATSYFSRSFCWNPAGVAERSECLCVHVQPRKLGCRFDKKLRSCEQKQATRDEVQLTGWICFQVKLGGCRDGILLSHHSSSSALWRLVRSSSSCAGLLFHMQGKCEIWTAGWAYLALDSGCEYCWYLPFVYSQKRQLHVLLKQGRRGCLQPNYHLEGYYCHRHGSPRRCHHPRCDRRRFRENSPCLPASYSTFLLQCPLSSGFLSSWKPILSASLCANVAGSGKDNSVVLHTSHFFSCLYCTDWREREVLPGELWERAQRSQPLTALVRGGSAQFNSDHLGEQTLLEGRGREREVGKGKREGKLKGRRSRASEQVEWNAFAEIKGSGVKWKREERDAKGAMEARWLWFAEEPQRVAHMFYSTQRCSEREDQPGMDGFVPAVSQERERQMEGGIKMRGIKWTSLCF